MIIINYDNEAGITAVYTQNEDIVIIRDYNDPDNPQEGIMISRKIEEGGEKHE